jgi:hypothetical protein
MLALSKKRTTMKKILLFALMTFFVQTSFCQNLSDTVNVEYSKNSPKRLTIGFGIPSAGLTWVFAPNLNKLLDSKKIDTWNILMTVPLTLNYQQDRFKIGGELVFSLPDSPRESQRQFATSLNANLVSITLGYAIFSERNYFLYLNLGAGYAEYLRTIEIKNPIATTLTSALQSGIGQSFVLRNKGAFLDVSLETMIRTSKAKAIGESFKLGYRYGFQENAWNSTFNSFTETPSDRMGNLYLQLILTLPYKRQSSSENSNNDKR